ncbi:hypothetical protein [Caulobacter sp. HMWF025]|uniref:hypothetical protein n=3 Tax=unclassified Caulobacter TaxID=2648921 RepID=UPI000D3502B4|nr:hypothetical protein [Caulobacter sp. HMWF025]PTT07389.1 hypothetical protein DBR10_10195 [Caulobacter sp. HMWF025]
MTAALALTAEGPAPVRRRRPTRSPWILLASLGAHLLALAALVAGADIMPQRVEPPAFSVELIDPAAPVPLRAQPVRPRPSPDLPRPAAATPTARTETLPPATPVLPTVPATPAEAVAPPGFRARSLTGGGEALREAARSGIGCRNADLLALTRAERAGCDETLGDRHKNGPALYAVIDPDKKAAFDGACKKDDDWCLYRTGKGPYPGLIALGRKKKIKDWD